VTGDAVSIVIVGGAAMQLLGMVPQTGCDVDVIALRQAGRIGLRAPDPLPASLVRAVATVAQTRGLPADWLNTQVATLWDDGLPAGFARRLHWREFGGLSIGIADRFDLIFFTVYAAADDTGPASSHFQDLLALQPSAEELGDAARWIHGRDPTAAFGAVVDRVVRQVERQGR
jgi:hypothetical protein